uniref:C3H1-type domain-containing protein n=1 Tax=Macrostomum lignano TaxID=282301 RepID=A0A1I8F2Y6_9PLAT
MGLGAEAGRPLARQLLQTALGRGHWQERRRRLTPHWPSWADEGLEAGPNDGGVQLLRSCMQELQPVWSLPLTREGCRHPGATPSSHNISAAATLRQHCHAASGMDLSAGTEFSEQLSCRKVAQAAAFLNAAAAAADSWDSAMSNSPTSAAAGGPVAATARGGFGCSGFAGGGFTDLGDFGGGGRYAEVSVIPSDEGFLEGAAAETRPLPLAPLDRPGPYDDDDLESSASSDGSEILQMVDQLLLAFNLEVQAESAGAAEEASESAEVLELLSASALATSFRVPTDGADEDSDYDDDEAPRTAAIWEEEEDGDYADNEASSSGSSASAASADPRQPQKQPSAFLATGLFRMPQEAVLEAMDYWGPLDRIRWLLWRPEPCPPRPEAQQQPQPQQLLDKSKRACSFLLKGRCRKEDCEFAHDLSRNSALFVRS